MLATLARLLSRDLWGVFLVTPATLLRWLVAEHRDLDVFLVWRRAEPQEVKEPADEQEGERAAHGDDLGRPA